MSDLALRYLERLQHRGYNINNEENEDVGSSAFPAAEASLADQCLTT